MNIEETIYSDAIAVNTIPVLDRLKELLKEHKTNSIKDVKDVLEVKECMWLLNHQYDIGGGFIEWSNLKDVRKKFPEGSQGMK